MKINEKAEGEVGKIIDLAVALVILFVVLGYVFAPVGSVGYSSASNIKTVSKNITNGTINYNVAPRTDIHTTINNASANTTFTLYFDSAAVGTYIQNQSTNTLYTTGGGSIYLNFTDIQTGYALVSIGTSSLYGLSSSSNTMWSAIFPIVLALIILVLVFVIKKVSA